MVNYLVRLGWSHGDQEVFTRDELIKTFQIERVGASPGIFDRTKLDWLNGLYLRRTPAEALVDLLAPFWPTAGVDPQAVADRGRAWLAEALPLFVERAKTLLELARSMAFLFAPPAVRDPKAEAKFLTPDHLGILGEVRRVLAEAPDFTAEALEGLVRGLATERGKKLVDYAQPVRVALTGTTISPPLFPVLALLGRKVVLERLDQLLARS
jgi:glutamyl-tRNA synthetase